MRWGSPLPMHLSDAGAGRKPRLPDSGVVPDNGFPAPGIGVEIPQVARWAAEELERRARPAGTRGGGVQAGAPNGFQEVRRGER